MSEIVYIPMHGGPHDGETVDIHQDNLKFYPIIGAEDEKGRLSEYQYDGKGKFVWLSDPSKARKGGFVCDDDGNIIAEAGDPEEALRKLDELNDPSEKWKFGRRD